MVNSYSISHCIWKWMKKLIFQYIWLFWTVIFFFCVVERKSQIQNFIFPYWGIWWHMLGNSHMYTDH
jgi:hypothetical protein